MVDEIYIKRFGLFGNVYLACIKTIQTSQYTAEKLLKSTIPVSVYVSLACHCLRHVVLFFFGNCDLYNTGVG